MAVKKCLPDYQTHRVLNEIVIYDLNSGQILHNAFQDLRPSGIEAFCFTKQRLLAVIGGKICSEKFWI
jgi:hypothetical protein